MERTLLLFILILASFYDVSRGKIPNWVIIFGVVAGIIRILSDSGGKLIEAAGLTILILALFYPFYYLDMLGAGDVKLFSLLGLFLLREQILYHLFFTFLFALIWMDFCQ